MDMEKTKHLLSTPLKNRDDFSNRIDHIDDILYNNSMGDVDIKKTYQCIANFTRKDDAYIILNNFIKNFENGMSVAFGGMSLMLFNSIQKIESNQLKPEKINELINIHRCFEKESTENWEDGLIKHSASLLFIDHYCKNDKNEDDKKLISHCTIHLLDGNFLFFDRKSNIIKPPFLTSLLNENPIKSIDSLKTFTTLVKEVPGLKRETVKCLANLEAVWQSHGPHFVKNQDALKRRSDEINDL